MSWGDEGHSHPSDEHTASAVCWCRPKCLAPQSELGCVWSGVHSLELLVAAPEANWSARAFFAACKEQPDFLVCVAVLLEAGPLVSGLADLQWSCAGLTEACASCATPHTPWQPVQAPLLAAVAFAGALQTLAGALTWPGTQVALGKPVYACCNPLPLALSSTHGTRPTPGRQTAPLEHLKQKHAAVQAKPSGQLAPLPCDGLSAARTLTLDTVLLVP